MEQPLTLQPNTSHTFQVALLMFGLYIKTMTTSSYLIPLKDTSLITSSDYKEMYKKQVYIVKKTAFDPMRICAALLLCHFLFP